MMAFLASVGLTRGIDESSHNAERQRSELRENATSGLWFYSLLVKPVKHARIFAYELCHGVKRDVAVPITDRAMRGPFVFYSVVPASPFARVAQNTLWTPRTIVVHFTISPEVQDHCSGNAG